MSKLPNKIENYCPNYKICGGTENKHNKVCYYCDNMIGYWSYKMEDIHNSHNENCNCKLCRHNIISLDQLDEEIGKLDIKEEIKDCCICLEEKNIFVKYPYCKCHNTFVCKDCFKRAYRWDTYPESPIKPENLNKFEDWGNEYFGGYFTDLLEEEEVDNYLYGNTDIIPDPKEEYPEWVKEQFGEFLKYYKEDR